MFMDSSLLEQVDWVQWVAAGIELACHMGKVAAELVGEAELVGKVVEEECSPYQYNKQPKTIRTLLSLILFT